MKKTKEWISDNFRYILLILAIALLVFLIAITLRIYQRYDADGTGDNIEIVNDTESLTEQTEEETETETESETEPPTETETETETEAQTGTEQESESEAGGQSAVSSVGDTSSGEQTVDDSSAYVQDPSDESADQVDVQEQEGADTWSESTGDYRTILSACNLRSYPDYGDNIIGTCYAGQTVEFLGEEAGWYKINADGVVGYIGPKFLG